MQIDTRLLRQFMAVYEQRSIGRAARKLHLTQPAVSKAIQRLEAELDVRLFDRLPLGMVPTAYAECLFRNGRRVESELRTAVLEIQELRGLGAGRVYVGASPGILSNLLPRAIQSLMARRPGLEIVIREGAPHEQLAATAQGDLDFVIGENPPDLDDTNLHSAPLLTDEIVVLCRRQHPLAARGRLRLGDLAGQAWVLTDRTEANRRRLYAAFAEAGLPPPANAIRTNSLICLRSILMTADYLTVLASDVYRLDLEAGLLALLDIPEARWSRNVSLTVRRGVTLPPAARALIAELRAHIDRDGRCRAPAAKAHAARPTRRPEEIRDPGRSMNTTTEPQMPVGPARRFARRAATIRKKDKSA